MAILFYSALVAEATLLLANAFAFLRGDPGLVDRLLGWQTSTLGAIVAAACFVALIPSLPPDMVALVPALRYGSLLALGEWGLG